MGWGEDLKVLLALHGHDADQHCRAQQPRGHTSPGGASHTSTHVGTAALARSKCMIAGPAFPGNATLSVIEMMRKYKMLLFWLSAALQPPSLAHLWCQLPPPLLGIVTGDLECLCVRKMILH